MDRAAARSGPSSKMLEWGRSEPDDFVFFMARILNESGSIGKLLRFELKIASFLAQWEFRWRDGRVVEGTRLESVHTPKGYRGFESLSLRQFEICEIWSPAAILVMGAELNS